MPDRESLFPSLLTASDGSEYRIDPHYQTALRLIAMASDDSLDEYEKVDLMLTHFYPWGNPPDIEEAIMLAIGFLNAKWPKKSNKEASREEEEEKKEEAKEAQFDYDFDSVEIYVSFLTEYGIDLFEPNEIHWFKFQLMVEALPEKSVFGQKIATRNMSLKGLKGKAKNEALKAKQAAALPKRRSKQTQEAMNEMVEIAKSRPKRVRKEDG